jgi:hypothetical protein
MRIKITLFSSFFNDQVNIFSPAYTEMEFLDINLTKDSSLLLHATSSTGGF